MLLPGLVSISFRQEKPQRLIEEAAASGLRAIEWGGDVHVPPTDPENARLVGQQTFDAGLVTASYGSYYRLGTEKNSSEAFLPVLQAAKSLKTSVIRIWAGTSGSAETPAAIRREWENEARTLAQMAHEAGVTLALECHGGTLTDRWESAVAFMQAVDHPGLRMYWQPNQLYDREYNLRAAQELAPYTLHLHVFHWDASHRYPLAMGREDWRAYLSVFQNAWENDRQDHGLLLEFMHDDRLETLAPTASELLSWIS